MKWRKVEEERPPHGELIWVWDIHNSYKFLIKYMGSEDFWFQTKGSSQFPIWAHLNEDDGED